MTTRYQKSQIEDVARILRDALLETIDDGKMMGRYMDAVTIENIARDFETLFAADNPRRCFADEGHNGACDDGCLTGEGSSNEGFDRKRFLAACGLESKG